MEVLVDKQELIYISYVRTQDVIWKTRWERWMIGTDGEWESRKSVQAVRLDDDDIMDISMMILVLGAV